MKYFATFVLAFALQMSWATAVNDILTELPKAIRDALSHHYHALPPLDSDPRYSGSSSNDVSMSGTLTWAGATIDMARSDNSEFPAIGHVMAQWNIPRLCLGEGQNVSSAGTLQTWIGISGKQCSPKGAMIQAGIKTVVCVLFSFVLFRLEILIQLNVE
jgi:hypothetical protein